MEAICDLAELERVVGSRQLPVMMKSIDKLDPHCVALLGRAPVAVLGYAGDGPRATVIGGAPGFAVPETPTRLRLPMPPDAVNGTGAALLVLLPGWRETLRINGTVDDGGLAVEEAFLHCGKAVIRSNVWGPATPSGNDTTETTEKGLGPAASAFLDTAPLAVITSRDGDGQADASPKGDPPGVIRPIGPSTVAIADRPGNRRTDTFHNVLERPDVAIVAVAPGDDRVLELTGTASVSADPALREPMSERGRTPKAVLLVEVTHTRLTHSAAIRDARLWDAERHVDPGELPKPAAIWTDHVKLNETTGIAAKLLRKAAGERMMRAAISVDYRQNLY